MKVTVSTTAYKHSHGHNPRGYGMWMFFSEEGGRVVEFHQRPAFFGAAKATAVALAKAEGIREIRVGS